MQPFGNSIPEEEQNPSEAQIAVLKSLAGKYKINIDRWIESNGKTWETITARDAGNMLSAIREKYGDGE